MITKEICKNCGKIFNTEPPYSSNCPFCDSLYGMSRKEQSEFIKIAKENKLSPEAMCLDAIKFRESITPDLFREIPQDNDVGLSHTLQDNKKEFKDKFPSLKDIMIELVDTDEYSDWTENYYDDETFKKLPDEKKMIVAEQEDIEKYCLDKSKVKEALIEFEARRKPDRGSICYSEEVRLKILKKRLGLIEDDN